MMRLWKKERPLEANVRRNDFSRDSTLSQNICFFSGNRTKCANSIYRNGRYRILLNSVIDGNVERRQHFFPLLSKTPVCWKVEGKLVPWDRSIANRCLSIQIQYPRARTSSAYTLTSAPGHSIDGAAILGIKVGESMHACIFEQFLERPACLPKPIHEPRASEI